MYRILIVEDDAVIAAAMERQITQWGLEARCVRDFRAVLEEFRAYDPHLVLLDLTLPSFDGYHWCREIRAASSVPVIFVSSAADDLNIVMSQGSAESETANAAKAIDTNFREHGKTPFNIEKTLKD